MPTSSSSPTTIRAREDPAAIRKAILAGAPGAIEIGDRGEAIAAPSPCSGPGDVLCVAGKGHETGQIVGKDRRCRSRIMRRSSAALAEAAA